MLSLKMLSTVSSVSCLLTAADAANDWNAESPCDEIRPEFKSDGDHGLIVRADEREGLNGWWTADVPVESGSDYRFSVRRRVTAMNADQARSDYPDFKVKIERHRPNVPAK